MIKNSILTFAFLLIFTKSESQELQFQIKDLYSEYESYTFKTSKGDSLNYRVLLPENYDTNKVYPVILFLHGAGERGDDNRQQLTHGGDFFLNKEVREKYPAIVVFPQCPGKRVWARYPKNKTSSKKMTKAAMLTKKMLKKVVKTEAVDKNRIYIMGLSMGGYGTFEMLSFQGKYYAAAAPICGGHSPERIKKYAKKVPLWIFHGADDDVVPAEESRTMYNALKNVGANVKYTEFPGVKHNSWDNVFETEEFLPWLFSHTK